MKKGEGNVEVVFNGETDFSRGVYFEREHAGCFGEVVGVIDWDAEVVRFRTRFGGPDVFCEAVVGGLPLVHD